MGDYGIRKLRKIQLGRETTAGTKVAASTVWRGTGVITDNLEVVFPEEDIGVKMGTLRTYIPKVEAQLELEDTPATFQQILHILEMGVETASATADGSGSGQIWVYPFAATADTASIKSYTIEGGDNKQEEEFAYGICTNFSLSGAVSEAVMMNATIIGQQVATGTFTSTATASVPTVEEILFQKGKIYIDADTAATFTQKTGTWREFTLDVNTGWQPIYTGSGNLYFSNVKNVGAEVTLDVVFEHETTAVAEIAAWRAQTGRKIRLLFQGSAFTTAGTSYTYNTLRIDLYGKWESFDGLDESDGNDTVSGTFRARWSEGAASAGNITVVNTLAAVQ